MSAELDAFIGRLKAGPAVLLLGQSYLKVEGGVDQLLEATLRKYGSHEAAAASYFQLLDTKLGSAPEAGIAWMHERACAVASPSWLKVVASFPWNSLYSSAIDGLHIEAFRSETRSIQPIFEERFRPVDPRNRLNLHCTYLFGAITQSGVDLRPPLTWFEWKKRRHIAASLARRLPDVVTPRGVLVIEGYAGSADWFGPDDLAPILDELGDSQVHVFSSPEGIATLPDFAELIRQGKVVVHSESLAATIAAAVSSGTLSPADLRGFADGKHIAIGGLSKIVPSSLWNIAARAGCVLDEGLLDESLTPLSPDEQYFRFRNFLSTTSGVPDWNSFARGFAFKRHFETALDDEVLKRLGAKQLQDFPIILHGQTGSGKTMALAALCVRLQRSREYPVLFIERKPTRPNPADVDAFCRWCESEGANSCLIVWDGMLEVDAYHGLLRYLTGRGRKAVLIGSSYRLQTEHIKGGGAIEAPADLLADEIASLGRFLARFRVTLPLGSVGIGRPDHTFLSALYRLLPPARGVIRTGVAREVGAAEQQLGTRALAVVGGSDEHESVLGRALRDAGLLPDRPALGLGERTVGGEQVTDMQDLTGLVMVAGQFGLDVPLELVLRVLGRRTSSQLVRLLADVDIFRWNEDVLGNIDIGARNSLEAGLLVEARMGGSATEIAFAQRLLLEIQQADAALGGDREIGFGVELLRKLGSSGPRVQYYEPHFNAISQTLRQLREERGVENPRLMLQEAHLLREWVVGRLKEGEAVDRLMAALDRVEEVLRRALEKVGKQSALRSYLLVELGSALAGKAGLVKGNRAEATALFEELRSVLRLARITNPTAYHPLDVLAWSTRNLRGFLGEQEDLEAIADVLHMFQAADPNDFDLTQRELFFERQLEFGEMLDLIPLAEAAFAKLAAQGSTAGYYLRALRKSGLSKRSLSDGHDSVACADALSYLLGHEDKIASDARCLDLALQLWWLVNVGGGFVARERATLPLTTQQCREGLEIIHKLERTGQSQRPLMVLFLRAVLVFHAGNIDEAMDLFRVIENDPFQVRGKARVQRSYVASNANGAPRKFHGTVAWFSDERGKGEVYVEELRRPVGFFAREFGKSDLRRGEALGEFHVAFNFLGPIADPTNLFKQSRVS